MNAVIKNNTGRAPRLSHPPAAGRCEIALGILPMNPFLIHLFAASILFSPLAAQSQTVKPKPADPLGDVPVAAQRRILAEVGNGKVLDVQKTVQNGAVVFDVEMTRNGRTRDLTVAASGELIDIQMSLDETPLLIQKTIQAAAVGGEVTDLSKTFDDGKTIYDVELLKGGKTRNFTVSAGGQLLDMEMFLEETPPAVKRAIVAEVGKGRLQKIYRTTEDGETIYDVEMTKGGVRDFTVDANGEVSGLKVLLTEMPSAAQKTVRAEVGSGKLMEIEKATDEGKVIYEVEMFRDGKSRDFTVGANGDLMDMEVFLDETPTAIKATIQAQSAGGQVTEIRRMTEDGEVFYDVEITKDGKARSLTVTANGVLSDENEAVASSSGMPTSQPREPASAPAAVAPLPGSQPGQPWTNSLGMKFVPVAGTSVQFSIWDTRVQDYETFVTATGRTWKKPSFEQGPTHPAIYVSWNDAKAFCAWLTDKERRAGTLPSTQEYRLPTDPEWSAAAGLENETGSTPMQRSGKVPDVYPWGTQWPPPQGAGNYGSKLKVDDFANTSPVGSFTTNRYGLYDMGGNVFQWCEDIANSGSHVLRGSSWTAVEPRRLLSSYRGNSPPGTGSNINGFRCVLAGAGDSAAR